MTNDDHYKAAKNEIKFRAFLPPHDVNELSIMRTAELTDADIWALGDEIAAQSGRTVYARGDLVAPDVRGCFIDSWRLGVVPDEPPVRHALITGWPSSDIEKRKSLAQQLRAKAQAHGRPVSA